MTSEFRICLQSAFMFAMWTVNIICFVTFFCIRSPPCVRVGIFLEESSAYCIGIQHIMYISVSIYGIYISKVVQAKLLSGREVWHIGITLSDRYVLSLSMYCVRVILQFYFQNSKYLISHNIFVITDERNVHLTLYTSGFFLLLSSFV